jgi:hypothetical protein
MQDTDLDRRALRENRANARGKRSRSTERRTQNSTT